MMKKGISFIFITHDMNLALEYADRAIVLHEGRIIANHTASIVLGHPETLKRANLKERVLYLNSLNLVVLQILKGLWELYFDVIRRRKMA